MAKEVKTFMIEDAQIIFRNFAGEERQFNTAGDRNFNVVLPPDVAQQMLADGWNVKMRDPYEEGDDPMYHLEVKVSFKYKPPQITMITSNARTLLTESMVEILDYADIKTVDIFCNGHEWDINGKQGTKAYLKTMFVTIDEDPLQLKYGVTGPQIHASEEYISEER